MVILLVKQSQKGNQTIFLLLNFQPFRPDHICCRNLHRSHEKLHPHRKAPPDCFSIPPGLRLDRQVSSIWSLCSEKVSFQRNEFFLPCPCTAVCTICRYISRTSLHSSGWQFSNIRKGPEDHLLIRPPFTGWHFN